MARRTHYVLPTQQSEKGNRMAVARNLNSLILAKGWKQSDLAREAEKHLPEGKRFGRHLISAYMSGKNMPSQMNLEAMAKALEVELFEIVPRQAAEYVGTEPPALTMQFTSNGLARVVLDMEMPAEKAVKIMAIVSEKT